VAYTASRSLSPFACRRRRHNFHSSCFNQEKLAFLYQLHTQRSEGEHVMSSAQSLLVDVKVEVLAGDKQPLKADPKCVQIVLKNKKRLMNFCCLLLHAASSGKLMLN
jgi:hypothetical protein